jgi:two-component system nitrate/nitrite response regulator NarL
MNKNTKNSDENTMIAKNRPSILIADDHLLLSQALAATLEAFPRFYKTALVSTLPEALDTLASGEVFDLVLLDLRMLGLKSIIEVINAAAPAKVCLFSDEVDLTIMHLAIENGASGLIPKTMSVKSFLSVVEFVLSGQIFIPANKQRQCNINNGGQNSKLNELELRIVQMTSERAINKEIATVIGVSEMTVKMHMRLICTKLNARNRAHAVTMARQYGLL